MVENRMGIEDASHGIHHYDHSANLGNFFGRKIDSLLVLDHYKIN